MGAPSVDLFLRMLVIGVAVAAPVGAMAVLSIQRTLAMGWRAGMSTGAGIATADALFAAVAAFGISAISRVLVHYQAPLRIVGGLGLLWLGWRALTAKPDEAATTRVQGKAHHTHLFGSAVGLTLTNPVTIIAFAAIFAGAGLVAQPGVGNALTATAGVALGSLLWWLALVTGVWAIRHALSGRAMLLVNRVSGVVLIAFGVLAGFSGARIL